MLKINQMNLNAKNYSECDYTYKLISSNFTFPCYNNDKVIN